MFPASLPVKHLNGEEVTPKMETISHKEFVTVVPDRHDLCSRCIMREVIECSQRGADALSPRTAPLCSLCLYRSHSITRHRVVSTNSEQEEELTAHNYTSVQTYVSQSLMPSMCEMGVTPLEVSLFVKCAHVSALCRPPTPDAAARCVIYCGCC